MAFQMDGKGNECMKSEQGEITVVPECWSHCGDLDQFTVLNSYYILGHIF